MVCHGEILTGLGTILMASRWLAGYGNILLGSRRLGGLIRGVSVLLIGAQAGVVLPLAVAAMMSGVAHGHFVVPKAVLAELISDHLTSLLRIFKRVAK